MKKYIFKVFLETFEASEVRQSHKLRRISKDTQKSQHQLKQISGIDLGNFSFIKILDLSS